MKKLLLIEDDEIDKEAFKRVFQKCTALHAANEQMEIIHAAFFKSACEILDQHDDIIVILLDLNLPDGSGNSLIEELTARYAVPVIALTGLDCDYHQEMQLIRSGAQDYISKNKLEASYLERSIMHTLERYKLLNKIQEQESEREKLIEQLTDSIAELERFAYMSSHDLQEPLRMVSSFSAILKEKMEEKLTEDEKRYLEIITSSSSRMLKLISTLQEYTHMRSKELKRESISLNNVLTLVKENLTYQLEETHTKIHYHDLPHVFMNPLHLTSLIQNLVSNAVKYQKSGSTPEITISYQEQEDCYEIAVKDNGIGMEEEVFKKIFLPFSRLHSNNEYAGTGIGLTICQKIVENNGGRIWLTSSPGKGTTFFFTLPKPANETVQKACVNE